jgi:hypothetical protein
VRARPAGGSLTLEEAMEREMEFHDKEGLLAYLQGRFDFWHPTEANVTIEPYSDRIDERTGWRTHLVCIDGKAALFTGGPMEGVPLPAGFKGPPKLIY